MPTKVVNIKDHPDWKEKGYIYIGRPSIYGNPFSVKDFGREGAIAKFEVHFGLLVRADEAFRKRIHALEGKTLVCYCKPKRCHGDVIKEYLDSERGEYEKAKDES